MSDDLSEKLKAKHMASSPFGRLQKHIEFWDEIGGRPDVAPLLEKLKRDIDPEGIADPESMRILLILDGKAKDVIANKDPSRIIGAKHRAKRSELGIRGNNVRWNSEPRNALKKMVQILSKRKDALGDPTPPADLWIDLEIMLDNANLQPVADTNIRYGSGLLGSFYTYGDGEKVRYSAFKSQINKARQKLKKK